MRSTAVSGKFLPAFGLCLALGLHGQQSAPNENQLRPTVPRLVRISSNFHPANGLALSPVEGVTLSIYREETGGTPLWQETQNVSVDGEGRYTVMMGSTLADGVPLELFTSSEPRWLGVQFQRQGETEQPRVRLASVPYALKAADAETLGGRPASAYLLNPATAAVATDAPASTGGAIDTTKTLGPRPKVTSGTTNCIAAFTNATDLGCSPMWQSGTSVGVNTTTPGATLDVQSNTAGFANLLNLKQTSTSGVGATGMTMTNQNAQMLMRAYTPGAPGLLSNSIGWFALNGSNKLFIGHAGGSVGNDVQFFTNNQWNNPQVTLTQAGNLGVGTTTPAFNLDVAGNINFSGSAFYQGIPVLAVPGGAGNGNTAVGLSALFSNGSGFHNTATGYQALSSNTTGSANTAVGYGALGQNTSGGSNAALGGLALNSNTSGSNDTGLGYHALMANTTGNANTAVGGAALTSNSTGNNNTAVGQAAMLNNSTGCCNVAVGQAALNSNTAGNFNTAVGGSALQNNNGNNNTAMGQAAMFNNTGGCCNVAVGQAALNANTTGSSNTAVGGSALQSNNANNNTAVGQNALKSNTTGTNNTAIGQNAMSTITTGVNNVAVGGGALASNNSNGNTAVGGGALGTNTGTQNVAVGTGALGGNTSGFNDIAIGWGAGGQVTGGTSNIHIGTGGVAGDTTTIRIGAGTSGIATDGTVQTAFFAAGIRGVTTVNNDAIPVVIDSAGQLGTASSSRRVKQDIVDMGDTTNTIMSLRPVRFRYKAHGSEGPQQYGLIAEEVAEVAPDLVAHTRDGEIETVYYDKVNAMLLNQVQKQQHLIEEQSRVLEQQRAHMQELEARLAALESSAAGNR